MNWGGPDFQVGQRLKLTVGSEKSFGGHPASRRNFANDAPDVRTPPCASQQLMSLELVIRRRILNAGDRPKSIA